MVTIAEQDYRRKHLTILKNLYSGDRVLLSMAKKAAQKMEEPEHAAFNAFQVEVGNLFTDLMAELEQGLEDLADVHPEEPDPRKWDVGDWIQFHQATEHHQFYDIYTTMGKGEPNIDLIWRELENRIFVS